MKKILFILGVVLSFGLHAQSIIELLHIDPSEQSKDFVNNKQQFQLHTLLTEQRHPKTWNLSRKIQNSTLSGIQALLSVDSDISLKMLELAKNTSSIEQAAQAIKNAILENRKIYIYGCGATGRVAKQIESSFWRPFWKKMAALPQWEGIQSHFANIENRLIGEMTGADRALISSLEGFEDLQLIGKLQLEEHQIHKGDVVFAITEGGETSSVIGTILAASAQYSNQEGTVESQKHLYFIYNNPDAVLLPFERSKLVLENRGITKICLATGPQSITGSTRMQATTSETFVMGCILEQAIYQLLEPHLSKSDLKNLGFTNASMAERLLSFIPLQKAVYNAQAPLSQWTDLEAKTYKERAFSTYFAKDALVTVFIDSTERAPTFRLFPLDTWDASPRKSWIQVWTPVDDQLQAWKSFLGRPFCGLNKELYEKPFSENIEDPYLKSAALKSLANAGNEQQYLYDFSYSKNSVETHGPQENDLGVLLLFSHEIDQLTHPSSPWQEWLKTFTEKKAKVALVLLPSQPLASDHPALQSVYSINQQPLIVQLPLEDSRDPLMLHRHVALKMLLNAHSTGVMAKLGRVVGNTMTSVNPGNLKLIGRATFLILSHVNDKLPGTDKISYADANALLFDAIEYGKKMQKVGQNAEVGLCVIRILEALQGKKILSWEEVEVILQQEGLEGYLEKITR